MVPVGGTDLYFRSPQPDTSLHCETTDEASASYAMSVYCSAKAGPHSIDPQRDGRLSRPSWPVTYLKSLPARKRLPIHILTRSDIN